MNYSEALDRLEKLKGSQGGTIKTYKSPLLEVLSVPPDRLLQKTKTDPTSVKTDTPPQQDQPHATRQRCEKGTPCALVGQETGSCRDHCRPAWEREAALTKLENTAPTLNQGRQEQEHSRAAWREEIETEWPEDYRQEWPWLAESYQRSGHPRAIAEHFAYLEFRDDARRFAKEGKT